MGRRYAMDTTTPIEITPEIVTVCELLRTASPLYVPVIIDSNAVEAACFLNVLNKIDDDGGSISYGWIVWQRSRLALSTEFHACWIDPSGKLVDITPKHENDIAEIVFAPDPSYPPDFDFWQRPNSHFFRTYQPTYRVKVAQERISRLTPSQIKYASKRAMQKGMSLEQWVESRLPVDPLPDLIDEFNRVCTEWDTLAVPSRLHDGIVITDPDRYEELGDKLSRIADRIDRNLNRPLLKSFSNQAGSARTAMAGIANPRVTRRQG